MSSKSKLWLVTLVLVLGAAAIRFFDQKNAPSAADARVGQSLLPAGTDLERIEIKKGEKTLVLVRDAQKTWRFGDDKGFPADAARVARLADDLMRVKLDSVVSVPRESLSELGFGAGATTVTLSAGGKPLPLVTLGNARKNGGQYVGLGEPDKAFLIAQSLNAAPDDEVWELKELLSVAQDQVKEVAFGGAAPVTLAREKKEDALTVRGLAPNEKEKPSAKASDSLGLKLTYSKRYDKSNVSAQSAMSAPVTTTVTSFDGKTYLFKVGSSGDATKKWFLSIEGDGVTPELKALLDAWWFEVSESVAQRFTKGRPDFIESSAG